MLGTARLPGSCRIRKRAWHAMAAHALRCQARQEDTMAEDRKDQPVASNRPPGVPAPPTREEIEQVSRAQAMIDDEWGDIPPPKRNKKPVD
jgi:hypothetical protein